MGTFITRKLLNGDPSLIPVIASNLEASFIAEGFKVEKTSLISGGADVSITKGGAFKAILGMKTALKITLRPQGKGIAFEAGIGIFGQQVIPTVISMFFFWPVLVTQIWGMVKQSKLDDKALDIAQDTINREGRFSQSTLGNSFCSNCGASIPSGATFCPNCGKKQ